MAVAPAMAASAAKTSPSSDETVELSPFTVNAERDVGYIATSSLAGSRLNTDLKDTAASISVLTAEFLEDIGATSVADAMLWSTNSQPQMQDTLALASSGDDTNGTFYNFDSFRVRGLSATQTRNYFDWSLPTDTYNIERIEEARGPNSILFGIGSAGGVVNTSTKRAYFGRDTRHATVGISSFGGYRGTIDVNQRLGQKLALRFNGIYDRTENFRNFIYSQKQMAALAATFKISQSTTLRAEYETGRVRQVIGTNTQVVDQYTSWIAAGSQRITTPITTAQNAAFGVTRLAATAAVTYFGNTGTLMNMANQYRTRGTTYVLDPSIVPYEVSTGGPGSLRRPHFDTATVAFEHQFGKNTFLELAYNHQQFLTLNYMPSGSGSLFIDPNATLPDGLPNPDVGKYFIEGESWAWDYGVRSDTARITLAHELDVGRWGKYRFAALGENQWRSPRNALLFEVWAGAPFHANPENQANVVRRRNYVTFGEWDSFYRTMPLDTGLIQNLTDPISGRTLGSTMIPRNAQNLRDNPEHQQSLLLAIQARYFKDRLVLGLGYRVDNLDVITRGTMRNDAGLLVSNYAANTFSSYEGRTRTLGVVYHITPKISLFYNNSDNFGLPPTIFLVPDGRRSGNPEGRGTDYGIGLSLFDGKLYARASYYKTNLVNGANSNYGSTTNSPGIIGDNILNALVAQGLVTAAEADSHRVYNTGSTFSQQVQGYELSVTANPTNNWRLQANFSYTDGFTKEVAPEVQAWVATTLVFLKTFDPNIATSNGTIAQRVESFEDYNNNQLAVQGLTLSGNRRYKTNLFTSYSFSAGMLKGLRVGGGYRHLSKMPIGRYPDRSLQYGNSYWDSNAMLGYRFAQSPVPWIERLSLQLNVQNVFNEDDAYIFRRTQDNPEVLRVVRVRDPRTWRLTASFDF